jgi:orotidine-5'-phosphate decarboxylase
MLMTDPKIIVAIDTFDFEKANAILEQLNPDHFLRFKIARYSKYCL